MHALDGTCDVSTTDRTSVPAAVCAAASSPTMLPASASKPAAIHGKLTLSVSSTLPQTEAKGVYVPLAPFVYLGIEATQTPDP